MEIGRTEGVAGPGRIEGIRVDRLQSVSVPQAPAAADRIEVSEVGRLVAESLTLPEVRLERIAELKQAVMSGTYLSEARLLGAIEKFLEEVR
ncbi:MAG: flagellar biosynthesis anti-sigma factor FlgM [Planctomycetes bacterium]|nr:flagellar biosynthesis anti-sigma factor FlgM [Planctomycetota bacterium]